MNKKHTIIGITGLARAGKDTACALLLRRFEEAGISAKRIALADNLKEQMRPSLLVKYSIDVLACSPEEKELIRPDLVAYGKVQRDATYGTYWTQSLESLIDGMDEDVIIVPDIRYDVYPKDERYWLQNKMGGLLLHIARFNYIDVTEALPPTWPSLNRQLRHKEWLRPPNEDEADNDPRMRASADFSISWPTAPLEELDRDYGFVLDTIVNLVNNELKRVRR